MLILSNFFQAYNCKINLFDININQNVLNLNKLEIYFGEESNETNLLNLENVSLCKIENLKIVYSEIILTSVNAIIEKIAENECNIFIEGESTISGMFNAKAQGLNIKLISNSLSNYHIDFTCESIEIQENLNNILSWFDSSESLNTSLSNSFGNLKLSKIFYGNSIETKLFDSNGFVISKPITSFTYSFNFKKIEINLNYKCNYLAKFENFTIKVEEKNEKWILIIKFFKPEIYCFENLLLKYDLFSENSEYLIQIERLIGNSKNYGKLKFKLKGIILNLYDDFSTLSNLFEALISKNENYDINLDLNLISIYYMDALFIESKSINANYYIKNQFQNKFKNTRLYISINTPNIKFFNLNIEISKLNDLIIEICSKHDTDSFTDNQKNLFITIYSSLFDGEMNSNYLHNFINLISKTLYLYKNDNIQNFEYLFQISEVKFKLLLNDSTNYVFKTKDFEGNYISNSVDYKFNANILGKESVLISENNKLYFLHNILFEKLDEKKMISFDITKANNQIYYDIKIGACLINLNESNIFYEINKIIEFFIPPSYTIDNKDNQYNLYIDFYIQNSIIINNNRILIFKEFELTSKLPIIFCNFNICNCTLLDGSSYDLKMIQDKISKPLLSMIECLKIEGFEIIFSCDNIYFNSEVSSNIDFKIDQFESSSNFIIDIIDIYNYFKYNFLNILTKNLLENNIELDNSTFELNQFEFQPNIDFDHKESLNFLKLDESGIETLNISKSYIDLNEQHSFELLNSIDNNFFINLEKNPKINKNLEFGEYRFKLNFLINEIKISNQENELNATNLKIEFFTNFINSDLSQGIKIQLENLSYEVNGLLSIVSEYKSNPAIDIIIKTTLNENNIFEATISPIRALIFKMNDKNPILTNDLNMIIDKLKLSSMKFSEFNVKKIDFKYKISEFKEANFHLKKHEDMSNLNTHTLEEIHITNTENFTFDFILQKIWEIYTKNLEETGLIPYFINYLPVRSLINIGVDLIKIYELPRDAIRQGDYSTAFRGLTIGVQGLLKTLVNETISNSVNFLQKSLDNSSKLGTDIRENPTTAIEGIQQAVELIKTLHSNQNKDESQVSKISEAITKILIGIQAKKQNIDNFQ